jgi:hypothetical protein
MIPLILQTLSRRTLSTSMALSDANRNVAENVPRLILFAMLASVSCKPCFFNRSASSRYPTSARVNSAFRKRYRRENEKARGKRMPLSKLVASPCSAKVIE